MQDVHQDLALLEEQGKAEGFFNKVENADKLSGLAEDVRDAMVDYQVRTSSHLVSLYLKLFSDVITTRHVRQELLSHREPHPIAFCHHRLTNV